MKVKIKDQIFNADTEPIMIIFDNDEEKIQVIRNLTEMPLKKNAIRKYCVYPCKKYGSNFIKDFMKLTSDEN